MKQLFTTLIALLILSSCTKKKELISDENISKFSKGSYEMPSQYGQLNLFVLCGQNEIIMTNADYLNYVYQYHYKDKFKSYHEFLSKILNQESEINKKDFGNIPFESFKINKKVKNEYEELKFDVFLKKYAIKNESKVDSYLLNIKNGTSLDEIMTISYYFYLNGYQTFRDDYFPRYILKKRDLIMDNK